MSRNPPPVAVVGISCRFPRSDGPGAFWAALSEGVDAITDPPPGRGRAVGGFLENVDRFDAAFFGISPREAAAMDPQQRLMLELAWEALEDARTIPADLRDGPAGVFAAATWSDYALLAARHEAGPHTMTGLNRGVIANRVSYTLGLRGPSLTVDTAQSSSLVAVHLAVQSLHSGECTLALAGGVNLILAEQSEEISAAFGGLSPDGRCAVFDAGANGYVRGEGGAVVALKPLPQALADGDRIYGVITGSATGNDGASRTLTTPDPVAQADVIRRAHARAGVGPGQVQYVELHGTGTAVGDPIEAEALGAALDGRPPRVGSVKTNIGHLESAAGIAGLVKTLLSVRHRRLVPTLHFQRRNPRIPAELVVQTEESPWPNEDEQLIAGVSSFGMGGTNCHVVVAEAPRRAARKGGSDGVLPWPISGRDEAALRGQAERLLTWLDGNPDASDAAIGLSLATTRTAFEHRAVVLAPRRDGVAALAKGEPAPGVVRGVAGTGRIVFVFPGQGSQWAGMAGSLWEAAPAFRDQLAACSNAFEPYLGRSLADLLRSGAPVEGDDLVQPALFAMMTSLAALWRSFGVEPAAVVGHSQGEHAAAFTAGALTLEDAARLVAVRSRALRGIAGRGGMVSLALPASEVRVRLARWEGRLWVAAVNGPRAVTVSGDRGALTELRAACEAEGVKIRPIDVAYASHSPHVDVVREHLLAELTGLRPRSAPISFYSTVTAVPLDTRELDAAYWFRNLRRPVLFEETVHTLQGAGHDLFVEISPHPQLIAGIQDLGGAVAGSLRRDEGGMDRFVTSLAEAQVAGADVTWNGLYGDGIARVDLPTYAFQRSRHWLDSPGQSPPDGPDRQMDRLADASAEERDKILLDLVRNHAATVLGHGNAEAMDGRVSFKALGFDSVTSVELCNRLAGATGLRLPSALLFNHPSPSALAAHLHTRLVPEDPAIDVDTASVDDLLSLIDQELSSGN